MIHFNRKSLLSLVLALTLVFCMTASAGANAAATLDLNGKLVVLHTNDIHGRAVADGEALGYARIAELKNNLEAVGASVLLLDAGDFSQGTPLVNLEFGKSAVAFMNATGYDAATAGNHEFDWGTDVLLQNLEDAEFSMLCANITDAISGEPLFTPNKIFDMPNGMKVGVFGLDTPEAQTKANPDKVKGIKFAASEELYAVAQSQVDELKAAGCDLVICLGHLGIAEESKPNRSIDVIANTKGIDLFVDGHSHTALDAGQMEGETLLVSTGSYSEYIGYEIYDAEGANLAAALYNGQDPLVADMVNSLNDKVDEQLSAAFATTTVDLNGERDPGVRTMETNLGDFACDAVLWAAQQALGEDGAVGAITNGGTIRASIKVGEVTMKDMKTVFPFGNQVTVLTVTGAELLEAMEAATFSTPDAIGAFPQVAGIVYTIDTSVAYEQGEQYPDSTYYAPKNPGSRVTIESIGGKPFDPEALYPIATNDFIAAGGDTYYAFRYAYQTSGYMTGVSLEDALVNYTTTVLGGTIGDQYAEPQGRITVK